MVLGSQHGRGSLLPDCSSKYTGGSVPFMSLSKAVGQFGSINHNTCGGKRPQWAAMVMGLHKALLSSRNLGEFLCLAQGKVDERNFLTSVAGHHNPSCRTVRKNWDRRLFSVSNHAREWQVHLTSRIIDLILVAFHNCHLFYFLCKPCNCTLYTDCLSALASVSELTELFIWVSLLIKTFPQLNFL